MIWSEAEMFKEEHNLIKKKSEIMNKWVATELLVYDPDRYRKQGVHSSSNIFGACKESQFYSLSFRQAVASMC